MEQVICKPFHIRDLMALVQRVLPPTRHPGEGMLYETGSRDDI
jgi:hypothetical protein